MNAVSEDLAAARQTMVDCQLRTFDVSDLDVLARARTIPREMFLPSRLRALAYSDKAIAVGDGVERRTLLAPMVLARMIQDASIGPQDNVLCIAGGWGYSAALIAGLARQVISLEDSKTHTDAATAAFARLGLENARAVTGRLAAGLTSSAPFDVILIEGAIETRPYGLMLQLADQGRLLAIENLSDEVGAGRVVRFLKGNDVIGKQNLFNASAPVLAEFAAPRSFVF